MPMPGTGAPLVHDHAAWDPRWAKGENVLSSHAVTGFQAMPAGGQCAVCTPEDFRKLIRFLADGGPDRDEHHAAKGFDGGGRRCGAVIAGTGAAGYVAATREKPEPPAPPATDKQGHLVWRNWSGIQHSYPELRLAPTSEEQLAEMLKSAPAPIRAVGAGHSFMPLVPTDGTL